MAPRVVVRNERGTEGFVRSPCGFLRLREERGRERHEAASGLMDICLKPGIPEHLYGLRMSTPAKMKAMMTCFMSMEHGVSLSLILSYRHLGQST